MVLRARSVSTSYASFEAELEGAILQHTEAVDHYLATAAPKWQAGGHPDDHATPHKLHSVFLQDINTSFWQSFTHSRGEISLFDDGALTLRGPCPPVTTHEPFNAAQLLRNSSKRRPRAHPLQVGESRLEQYLHQDLQRYIDMREQLDTEAEASAAEAALLSAQLQSRTSSSSSFVRFPELDTAAAEGEEEDAATPLAPAMAALAAMAAVHEVYSSHGGEDPLAPFARPSAVGMPAAAGPARISLDSIGAAAAAVQQPQQQVEQAAAALESVTAPTEPATAVPASVSSSSISNSVDTGAHAAPAADSTPAPQAAAAAPARSSVPFTMEADEDIAAQKAAARARLAELEGEASATSSTVLPAGKAAAGKCVDDDDGPLSGSVHSSLVPQRPRGLAGLLQQSTGRGDASADSYMGGGKGDGLVFSSAAAHMQHYRFFQTMMVGLVLCIALLPALWGLQALAGGGSSPVHSWMFGMLEAYCSYLYVPAAAGLLLYIFRSTLLLRPPLLHFANAELEERYLMWSNSGKLFVDSMFQVLFLVVGSCLWLRLKHRGLGGEEQATANTRTLLAVVSMMGSGLPMVVLLLLRSVRYVQWREQLLAGSRVCSIIALLVMQLSLPADCAMQLPLSMPFVALAQLMGIACMQVRLATFVPCQVLHLLVLLLKTQAQNPMLHFVQLFGGGLCLPCLLLHSMEMYSRKAFLATVANFNTKKTV